MNKFHLLLSMRAPLMSLRKLCRAVFRLFGYKLKSVHHFRRWLLKKTRILTLKPQEFNWSRIGLWRHYGIGAAMKFPPIGSE